MKNSNFWQNVDGICLINLDQRKDRLISALEQLKTLVPSEKVRRVAAIDGKRLKGLARSRGLKMARMIKNGLVEQVVLYPTGRH